MTPEYLMSPEFAQLQAEVKKYQEAWSKRKSEYTSTLRDTAQFLGDVGKNAESDFEAAISSIGDVQEQLSALIGKYENDKKMILAAVADANNKYGFKVAE